MCDYWQHAWHAAVEVFQRLALPTHPSRGIPVSLGIAPGCILWQALAQTQVHALFATTLHSCVHILQFISLYACSTSDQPPSAGDPDLLPSWPQSCSSLMTNGGRTYDLPLRVAMGRMCACTSGSCECSDRADLVQCCSHHSSGGCGWGWCL